MIDRPKYENWFECLLMFPPKLNIVIPPQEEDGTPEAFDPGKDTEFFSKRDIF